MENQVKRLRGELNEVSIDPELKKAIGQTVKKVTDEVSFSIIDVESTVITFKSGKRLELFVLTEIKNSRYATETYWKTTHGDMNKMKGKTISDFNQTNKGSKLTFIFSDGSKIKLEARTESGAPAWFNFDFK